MPSAFKESRYSFFLFACALVLLLTVRRDPDTTRWLIGLLYIPDLHPFLDIHNTLAHSEGYALGWDVKHIAHNPLDVIGRGYPAISIWWFQIFSFLGLERTDANWIGVALALLYFFSVPFLLLRPKTMTEAGLSFAIMLAPGACLSIERANVDLIIFLLLIPVPMLVANQRYAWAWTLNMLCTGLKYYPIMAVFTVFFHRETRHKNLIYGIGSAAFLIVYILIYYEDLSSSSEHVSRVSGIYTFGFDSIFPFFGITLEAITRIKLGVIILGGLWVLRLIFYPPKIFAQCQKVDDWRTPAAIMGIGILIFCYFALTSFEYRLIFYFFAIPLQIEWIRHKGTIQRTLGILSTTILLVLLWGEQLAFLSHTDFATMKIDLSMMTILSILVIKHALWMFFIGLQLLIFALLCREGLLSTLNTIINRKPVGADE